MRRDTKALPAALDITTRSAPDGGVPGAATGRARSVVNLAAARKLTLAPDVAAHALARARAARRGTSFSPRSRVRADSDAVPRDRASSKPSYLELLTPGSLSDETISTVKRLERVKRLFYRRRSDEDTCVAIAFLGIALMVAEVQRVQSDPLNTRDLCFGLKCAVSATTALLLLAIWRKYRTELAIRVTQGKLPARGRASIMTTPALRGWFVLELFLCALHVPPGLSDDLTFSIPAGRGQMETYVFDVLGVVMWVRLYLMASLLRNHSGYYSQQVSYVCALNNVEAESPSLHFKLMFCDQPLWLLGPFGAVVIVATTLAVQAVEFAHNEEELANLWDCFWLTVITISTVGYGDRFPRTILGRFFVLVGGVVCGVIFIGLVTTVLLQHVQLHPNEAVVLRYHRCTKWNAEVIDTAATLIQRAYRWHLEDRAGGGGGGGASRVTESYLYQAVCLMKRLRAGQPLWQDEEMSEVLNAVQTVEAQVEGMEAQLAEQARTLANLETHVGRAVEVIELLAGNRAVAMTLGSDNRGARGKRGRPRPKAGERITVAGSPGRQPLQSLPAVPPMPPAQQQGSPQRYQEVKDEEKQEVRERTPGGGSSTLRTADVDTLAHALSAIATRLGALEASIAVANDDGGGHDRHVSGQLEHLRTLLVEGLQAQSHAAQKNDALMEHAVVSLESIAANLESQSLAQSGAILAAAAERIDGTETGTTMSADQEYQG